MLKLKLSQDDIDRGVLIKIAHQRDTRSAHGLAHHTLPKVRRSSRNRRFISLPNGLWKRFLEARRRKGEEKRQRNEPEIAVAARMSMAQNDPINTVKMRPTEKVSKDSKPKKKPPTKRNKSKSVVKSHLKTNQSKPKQTDDRPISKLNHRPKRSVQFKNVYEMDGSPIDNLQQFNDDDENEDDSDYDEETFNRHQGNAYRNEERLIRDQKQKKEAEFLNSKDGHGYSSDRTQTIQFNEADEMLAEHRKVSESGDGTFLDVVQRMADEGEHKIRDARSQPINYGNQFMNDENHNNNYEDNLYGEYDEYENYENSY